MSTIKSDSENLTLNAHGSGNDLIFQSNGSQVGSLTAEGVLTATSFAGSGANLTGITGGATGVDFNDNVKARFGTGNDLEIYHDGSHSRIKDVGTGNLYIYGSDQVNIQDAAGEPMINCVADGAVQLAHHGDYKLATSATGVTVTGAIAGATNLGKVLQVKWHELTSQSNSTSTSWVDTNSITLTPASGSKLLFIHTLNVGLAPNASYDAGVALRIYRDGTTAIKLLPASADSDASSFFIKSAGASGTMMHASHTATYLYTHGGNGSTSMTFKTQRRLSTNSPTSYFQYYSSPSTLTIIEIGA